MPPKRVQQDGLSDWEKASKKTVVGLLRRHGGDGGATAVLVRCHASVTAVVAMPRARRAQWRSQGATTGAMPPPNFW